MEQLKKFKIEVAQNILDDLKTRLENTRWTDEPEHDGWNYGTNPKYLRELVDYWKNTYDWRKHEAQLNEFPQFTTTIDGTEIHFLYIKGKGNNPKPIILTHEWPDSFYRFYKIIPMLTDPEQYGGNADQSFDVIIPSMPGHGFSARVSMSSTKTAQLWLKLMKETLGYTQFLAAGDFAVTTALAQQAPETVQAIHLTDAGYPNGTEDWGSMTPEEQAFGQHIQRWWFMEGAFNMIQATKPQTLGYGLNDSPVGLASWIVEKLYAWSDTKGNLDNSLSKDEVLTNIMIYWVTQTINSSIRRYMEDAREMYATGAPAPMKRVEVPTSVAIFPADSDTPRAWAERRLNVKRFTKMPSGGRFAALEVPELYVNDLRDSFFQ
jgi:pimeloyl-ACP methyl ester carboxylesterase